jgi:hypothetical protein
MTSWGRWHVPINAMFNYENYYTHPKCSHLRAMMAQNPSLSVRLVILTPQDQD